MDYLHAYNRDASSMSFVRYSQRSHCHPSGQSSAQQASRNSSLRHLLVSVLVVSDPIMLSHALSTTTADTVAPIVPYSLRPRVAVIGAGAAGLAAARVISRDTGVLPVVLEKDLHGGGVWRYQPSAKDRPMYSGLRTNLPKELMAFREYPFHDTNIKESFVTHTQVQEYLLDYQRHFELNKFIHYGCTVRHLKVLHGTKSKLSPSSENWPQIQLEWTTTSTSSTEKHGDDSSNKVPQREIFDAVLVCNGHYAAPSSPYIPGLDQYFQGKIMHSIEYDTPEQFRDQVVLCIGGRASGADLAREISCHAKHIYLSDTTCQEVKTNGKVTLVPKTISVDSDGRIQFAQDCPVRPDNVDTIILCSGYDYQFPFIDTESSNLDLSAIPGERRVQPLIYQLWHAKYPSLVFLGLPHSVVPFPLFELQSEAVVAQWAKEYALPTLEERIKLAATDAASGGPRRGRVQDTHFLGDFQWDYCRQLVELAQRSNREAVLDYIRTNQELYDHAGAARKSDFPGGPDQYRSIRYARPSWREWKVVVEEDCLTVPSQGGIESRHQ